MAKEKDKKVQAVKDASYYDTHTDDSQYAVDLLTGAVRIYQVPQKYRVGDSTAYIYAIRFARDLCESKYGKNYMKTEKRLIETCLIRDIMDMYKNEETVPLAEELRRLYDGYYSDGTIDWIGLI